MMTKDSILTTEEIKALAAGVYGAHDNTSPLLRNHMKQPLQLDEELLRLRLKAILSWCHDKDSKAITTAIGSLYCIQIAFPPEWLSEDIKGEIKVTCSRLMGMARKAKYKEEEKFSKKKKKQLKQLDELYLSYVKEYKEFYNV